MTHTEALKSPYRCPGRLVWIDSQYDRRISRDGVQESILSTYRCERCQERVVVEHRLIEPPDGQHAPLGELDWTPVGSW